MYEMVHAERYCDLPGSTVTEVLEFLDAVLGICHTPSDRQILSLEVVSSNLYFSLDIETSLARPW